MNTPYIIVLAATHRYCPQYLFIYYMMASDDVIIYIEVSMHPDIYTVYVCLFSPYYLYILYESILRRWVVYTCILYVFGYGANLKYSIGKFFRLICKAL